MYILSVLGASIAHAVVKQSIHLEWFLRHDAQTVLQIVLLKILGKGERSEAERVC